MKRLNISFHNFICILVKGLDCLLKFTDEAFKIK